MTPMVMALAERLGAGRTMAMVVPDGRDCPAALALLTDPAPGRGGGLATAVLVRTGSGPGAPVVDQHLRVDAGARGPRPDLADVVIGSRRIRELARRHPAAPVVASPVAGECWLRPGPGAVTRLRVISTEPFWPVWGSLLHGWLAAGLPPGGLASATGYAIRHRPGGVAAEQSVLFRRACR
ncbi:hypothetical protein [Streptomyces litchfieldiae]|uniref:Uncharacterized protein n=1 Tax=Streptomyces litchfieldiae TaxID=3075543 RepID=A0ABU2MMX0_9ACTN|nr:hypothetical protein [Streptomyces sp. DSM 44938]MDT0342956.1 hypothetical protein [Streptomyces sp. DSM 44938]